jgi:hypothetical protein
MPQNPVATSITNATNGVILTDPNEIIAQQVGGTGQNAIPDYELMSPYVEMYAIRKEGVEIVLGEDGAYQVKGENKTSKINFLNFDTVLQSYTTNYTGDIVGTPDRESNEGFGISEISVKMNANYMPMVEAKFIDIKGSSVIRPGDKSPLAVLFDFPAPLFKMRLKGAFGKFVEYDLHMTKNDVEYTDNGDFVIKASFIGEYFGPLTDVLLGYIKSVPSLKGKETTFQKGDTTLYQLESGEQTTINSFFELVNRGELLYTKIADYQASTTKTKSLADKQKTLQKAIPDLRTFITGLENFDKQLLLDYGKKQNPPITDGLNIIQIGKYLDRPHTFAFTVPVTYDSINPLFTSNPLTSFISTYINEEVNNKLAKLYDAVRTEAKDTANPYNSLVKTGKDEQARPGYFTVYIDYADLLAKVQNLENIINGQINKTAKDLQADLSKIVKNNIDFRPSIRNVFEILLNDFDSFLTIIKKAGETTKPLGEPQYRVKLEKPLVQAPFPEVVVKKVLNNKEQIGAGILTDVLVYPGTFQEFREWEEVKLVEAYCKSLVSQIEAEQAVENLKETSKYTNYIPLFPLESYLDPSNEANPYVNISSATELFQKILLDYVTLRDFAYGVIMKVGDEVAYNPTIRQRFSFFSGQKFILNPDSRKSLVKLLAHSQARNIANAIAGTNNMSQLLIGLTGNKLNAIRSNLDSATLGNKAPFYLKIDGGVDGILPIKRAGLDDEIRYRTDKAFNGIKGIINPEDTELRKLIEDKIAVVGSDFDKERQDMLEAIASTIYGTDNSYKPVVTEANTLLFHDSAASKGTEDGETDFSGLNGYITLIEGVMESTEGNPEQKLKAPATKEEFFSKNGRIENAVLKLGGKDTAIAKKFLYPAAVETPYWYILYIGYLLKTDPSTFGTAMSTADRAIFTKAYDNFDYNKEIVQAIAQENLEVKNFDEKLLKLIITKQSWFKKLIAKRYIINNSSTTFLEPENLHRKAYGSVELKEDEETLSYYLEELIGEVQKKLKEYTKKNEGAITEAENKFSDPDFKLNVYMSFKTIYDRWLAGNNDYIGEASQKATNPLRERFKFITRSQQDIGDLSIVDFRNFLEDAKNPEMNVFSSISRLLSQNQYMFFPLHSFMEYNKGNVLDNWENNFKILHKYSEKNLSKPSFVCMYIGSYSSRLNTGGSGHYASDGFSIMDSQNLPSDFSDEKRGNVFAFNVKVGSQSQMIFSNFTANTTEFKNTDVSLKIQDDIINKQTESNRVGKAQNLLNIYQQRSYTMGVTIPFGNMCIQPTQYFEITGIPIWNGVYMIHEVSHTITAGVNKLVTQFKGYKLGKYTFPVVTDYLMSILGISNEFGSDAQGIATSVDVSILKRDVIDEVNKLEPMFVPVFFEFLASVAADGWDILITNGRRTREQQIEFNKQDKRNPLPGGKYDSHIQGLAIDCNFTKGNIKLRSVKLGSSKEQWLASGIPQKAIAFGLRWGGNFNKYEDLVHFDAGFPDGITLGPRTVQKTAPQVAHSGKYDQSKDTGLFLSSLLPYGSNNERFQQDVRTTAANLLISPNALMAVMYLESEFKTSARSRTSSAAGLIQFVTPTAVDYTDFFNKHIRPQAPLPHKGLTSSVVASLNELDQLKLVGEFLRRNLNGAGSRKNSFFDVSFSIFHPSSQQKPDENVMFGKGTSAYRSNRDFDKENKGFVLVKDYKNHILNRIEQELGLSAQTFQNLTA